MPSDEPVDPVAVDAEAIDDALAAFEDACAQLVRAAADVVARPDAGLHLAAVRDRLATVSVPVTPATADALVLSAADARAALQRVLAPDGVPHPDSEDVPHPDPEEESPAADPTLDLAPGTEQPPPPPPGYRACTTLPTRNIPHVLVFADGRWQRGAIVYAPDDTLMVRTATARRGVGRRLDDHSPAHLARPYAQG